MKTLKRIILFSVVAAIFLGLVSRSIVAVDESRYVLVTDFGRRAAIYGPEQSGWHAKLPWQSAIEIDRRLRVFDAPPREVITGDKKNLEVSAYVVWRVSDPERFVVAAGTVNAAEARLGERVAAGLSNAIGQVPLDRLASTDAKSWGLDSLTRSVREALASSARDELGVEIVDVRLRRFNHPLEVRPAVFDLIRSERKQVASALRAEGEARYQTLTSQADRERDVILAQADAEAERIRARAEADSTRRLNEAHAKDPKFYEFLKTLETCRAVLDDKTTIILSSGGPWLRLLTQGPPLDEDDRKREDSTKSPARVVERPEEKP